MFSQLRDLLQTLGRRQPLMLLVDDLQWADSATLQLFSYIPRLTPGMPFVLSGASRAEALEGAGARRQPLRELLQQLRRERLAQEVEVRPLTMREADRLLA